MYKTVLPSIHTIETGLRYVIMIHQVYMLPMLIVSTSYMDTCLRRGRLSSWPIFKYIDTIFALVIILML